MPPQANSQPQGNVPPKAHDMDAELRGARGNATASLVCGILGFVVPVVGIVLAIIAMVLGLSAKKRLPENERGMASAGSVLGLVGLVFSIIALIFMLWFVSYLTFALLSAFTPYYW